ncbi:MAG: NifB/NifX family molybdenum-iron cluster-binding protein [Planctomycetota bacterium]
MRLAITAQGTTLDSPLDPRFGRARHFVLFDTESETLHTHDNQQNLSAAQGAGIQAAQTVVCLGASALLTGHVGPKAFAVLRAGNVAVYVGLGGTIRDAIEQWRSGTLVPAEDADVDGHWA